MNKTSLLLLVFITLSSLTFAQEKQEKQKDSLTTALNKKGIVVSDSTFIKKQKIDPLAPSKAAFYSAILPGLGQVYNKKYWKVPIVFGAIGSGVYLYKRNNDQYNRYRDAFKSRKAGKTNDEFWGVDGDGNPNLTPRLSTQALQDAQNQFQRNRDLSLLITIGLYALNIIDANVDAHLKQFNVNDNLSFKVKPYIDQDYAFYNQANFGLKLTLDF